jgi:hypothetical protein
LSTGNPQDEYRNDLTLVLIQRSIRRKHILHEAFADHCTVGDWYRAFGREESVPRSTDLSVLFRRYISKKDIRRHERYLSA